MTDITARELYDAALEGAQGLGYTTVADFTASTDPARGVGSVWIVEGSRFAEVSSGGSIQNVAAPIVYLSPIKGTDGLVDVRGFGISGETSALNNRLRIEAAYTAAEAGGYGLKYTETVEVDEEVTITAENVLSVGGGSRSTINSLNGGIKLADGSTATNMLKILGAGNMFRDMVLNANLGATTAGTSVFIAEDGVGDNSADVDLYFEGCTIGGAETLGFCNGRGLYLHSNNLVLFTHAIDFTGYPGAGFVPGGNSDQTLTAGFRSFRITDNRIHAASGGFLVRNEGTNKDDLRGLLVCDNQADTLVRMASGAFNDTLFNDNQLYNTSALTGALFVMTGGTNIQINGGTYSGMYDNGLGAEREMLQFADLTDVDGFTVAGVDISRVNRDVIVVQSGCDNVKWIGGVCRDFCLENDGASNRYPVRLNADVPNLAVSNVNFIKSVAQARDGEIVGQSSGVEIVEESLKFEGNIYPDRFIPFDHSTTESQLQNLPDDGVFTFRPVRNEGIIELSALGAASIRYSKVVYEGYGTVRAFAVGQEGAGWAASITTGVTPTGTTGTDGEIAIFYNDGIFYLENRLGAALAAFARETPLEV